MARRRGQQQTVGKSLKTLFVELSFIAIVLSIVYFVAQVMEMKAVEQYMDMFNISRIWANQSTVTNESINFAVNLTNYTFGNPPVISVTRVTNATDTLPTEMYENNATYIRMIANATFVEGNWNATYVFRILNAGYYQNADGHIAEVSSDIAGMRSGYTTAKTVISLGLSLLGLVMVMLVFAGYLIPVVQSIF